MHNYVVIKVSMTDFTEIKPFAFTRQNPEKIYLMFYLYPETPGVSTDPCSVIYGGSEAESEPEVRAVIRFLRERVDVIKSYVALHSYSQLWMTPFSYTSDTPKDYPELVSIIIIVLLSVNKPGLG